MVKAVIYNGDNLLDAPYTFQQGQQLRNVQVIVTDKRSDITFRVADENGQSTRDYVALLYPVDKTQWSQAVRFLVGPPAGVTAVASRVPAVNGSARGPRWSRPRCAASRCRPYGPASTTPSPWTTWSRTTP